MNNLSKIKGVIFDLDGTLLYTLGDITKAINYALLNNKLSTLTENEVKYLVGSGAKVFIERVVNLKCEESNLNKEELFNNLYNDYMDKYKVCCTDSTKPYNGIVRTLNSLKRLKIKLAVLSNKPQRDTESVINRYFDKGIFDVVVGGRDGVKLKPDSEALYETIKEMGLTKDEILYVGDSDIDVLTYQNAKVLGISVCYGYRNKKELEAIGATNFVNAPAEIVKLFERDYNGVLLINKPYKMTSQTAVNHVKKKLGITKVGHAGTLDPLATGLLVVLLGDATKLSNYLLEEDKEYIAEVLIGAETPTWDLESEYSNYKFVDESINEEIIDKTLLEMTGDIMLPVPSHSAVKVDGKKLYEKARSGKEISEITRCNHIYELKRISSLEYSEIGVKFKVICHVSKGTYIRSICREIGLRLNYPSVMTSLVRTKSGRLSLDDSCGIDDDYDNCIIPIIEAINEKDLVEIRPTLIHRVINGREISLPNKEKTLYLTYNDNGKKRLVGIYERRDDNKYHAVRVWRD